MTTSAPEGPGLPTTPAGLTAPSDGVTGAGPGRVREQAGECGDA